MLVESNIPARLDRLPWSRWHWLIVVALGITWVLDGLEVTLAGAIGAVLKRPDALGLSDAQVGASATCYLLGAVAGALLFGLLIETGSRTALFAGYLIGAGLMIIAAVVEATIGVPAERKSLEAITRPLSEAA